MYLCNGILYKKKKNEVLLHAAAWMKLIGWVEEASLYLHDTQNGQKEYIVIKVSIMFFVVILIGREYKKVF